MAAVLGCAITGYIMIMRRGSEVRRLCTVHGVEVVVVMVIMVAGV